MCGICGVVNLRDPYPAQSDFIERMTTAIQHRGPDEDGFYFREGVGLGMRRLSIIDLSSGKQPISNEDESIWIVFNGEIYNYRELHAQLEKLGHTFRTKSDTEVIVHLYEQYGPACVQKLNGMFAFAIWDSNKRELLIARDYAGIKPLYYAQSGDTFVFASEMKALLVHPAVKRELNLDGLNEYLTFEYVPTPHTIIQNVFRLPPGHFLCYNETGLKLEQYWDLDLSLSEGQSANDPREYSEQLFDVLRASVQKELVSDVPVGVFLSGGVDSSTVAALMTQLYPERVQSFSIAFDDPSFDESRFFRLMSTQLRTDHHEITLSSKQAAQLVPNLVSFMDEPFADSSIIPTYFVSQLARRQVKVVLSGDGGDELFAGYPTLLAHRLFDNYQRLVPRPVRTGILPVMLNQMPVSFNNLSFDFRLRRFVAGESVPLQERHHGWLGSFSEAQKAKLFQGPIQSVLGDTYAIVNQHAQNPAKLPLNKILYDDFKMYLESGILVKVDRASMANSLEVRVPLLNRDVLNFAARLPIDLKLHGLTGKYLLKRTIRDIVPEAIITRKKKGFNMPVARWLNGDLREILLDTLSEVRLKRQGYFNTLFVKSLIDEHFTRQCDHRKELWTLLMFQLWHDCYLAH